MSNDNISGTGQKDTEIFSTIGGHEANGLGYHDFNTPIQQKAQGNQSVSPGMASSEVKKTEYRKITEERKFREVPKSRKDLKKKINKNPKLKNGDSPS